MQAAVHYRYGPPDVISLVDIPKPSPPAGSFLVRVCAATVNRTDSGFRSAEYVISRLFSGLLKPKNPVLGCEFAGVIEKLGDGVTDVHVGQRIVCFNDARFGGHAEYALVRVNDAYTVIPDSIPWTVAAALLEGSHYALCSLRAANVDSNTSVLIYGATGAIGSAAVQLALAIGAQVTAVCGPMHVRQIHGLGAHRTLDYTTAFTELSERFDVVYDAVGKLSWKRCKPLLTRKGVYISTELGAGCQNPFLALVTPLFGGRRVLFPIPTISKADVHFLLNMHLDGHFTPLIDRVLPFESIVEAYRYVDAGQKIGNVVLSFEGG